MMVNIFNWDYAWGSIQTEGSKRSERLGCSIAQLWTCFIWQLYLFFFNSNLHNSVLKYSSRFQADLIEPSLEMTDTLDRVLRINEEQTHADSCWKLNMSILLMHDPRVSESVWRCSSSVTAADEIKQAAWMTREMEFIWHLSHFFFARPWFNDTMSKLVFACRGFQTTADWK